MHRARRKKKSRMLPSVGLFILCLVRAVSAHSHGVFSCSSPVHRSLPSDRDTSISAAVEGSNIVISSASKFRGFLFSAGEGLVFTNAPEQSAISDICYRAPGRAISHTSALERNELVIGFSCVPGTKVSVSGYVVFKYSIPFVNVGGSFTCPEPEVVSTTTFEPTTTESSTSTLQF